MSPNEVLIVTCVILVSSIIGISASSFFLEQELRTNANANVHRVIFNKL
jgi:hypothetical protein